MTFRREKDQPEEVASLKKRGTSHSGKVTIPRIVIGGVSSGCGKTTVAKGIMQALVRQGLVVQPFKIGPDFIDPSHHTALCGRPSFNLDLFIMGEQAIRNTVAEASRGADIAVIEGVMGLYDGLDGTTAASTADVAAILSAPVILVIDVSGMSASAHAIVRGFRDYNTHLNLGGVIFNRVGSERHATMINQTRESEHLGFIQKDDLLSMQSRHLGLFMGTEIPDAGRVGDIIGRSCDLGKIKKIAQSAPVLSHTLSHRERNHSGNEVKVGIASDSAFCFYYRHNLDLLEQAGADLVFFSPITDPLPDVDALYLGGGYPELYAKALSSSRSCRQIPGVVDDGMPVYAECGGLLFLTRGIELLGGEKYKWAGVLGADATMHARFCALGYTKGICRAGIGGPDLAPDGIGILGHEFHYSSLRADRDATFAIELSRGEGITDNRDGMYIHNTMGCYTHSYFSETFAEGIVSAAHAYRKQ